MFEGRQPHKNSLLCFRRQRTDSITSDYSYDNDTESSSSQSTSVASSDKRSCAIL